MFVRRRDLGAASKQHVKTVQSLYPKRPDSQVTPLGVYKRAA